MSEPILRPPFVFLDVDTQRDFLDPNGALHLRGSVPIRANLARLTDLARRSGIPVLATACAHTPDEEDPEPFPPHCLVGTPGQERINETAWEGGELLRVGEPFTPTGAIAHLTVEKTRYDAFSRPEMGEAVDWMASTLGGDPTFVVYGVATDYCVACAVRGLLARGRRVVLVADAVFAVDPANEADCMGELVGLGAVLTVTDAVAAGVSEGGPRPVG